MARIHPTYFFRGQDPRLGDLKAITINEARARGISFDAMVARNCGLSRISKSTPHNWFITEKVKRPQNATMSAFGGAMGKSLQWGDADATSLRRLRKLEHKANGHGQLALAAKKSKKKKRS